MSEVNVKGEEAQGQGHAQNSQDGVDVEHDTRHLDQLLHDLGVVGVQRRNTTCRESVKGN